MIARNHKVEPEKRAEKEEIMQWFKIWLETPETFFDWVELRKQSPEYQKKFGEQAAAAGE
jgi:formylmethanofuran dehydrogenase subunit E